MNTLPSVMPSLPSLYQEFIHISRYSRFRWDFSPQRRETWGETISRYVDYMGDHLASNFPKFNYTKELRTEIFDGIANLEVMPSMRAFMTAGAALEKDHLAGYNCSYIPIDNIAAFSEILYVLMCGTGVGFSVERQYIKNLPRVPERLYNGTGEATHIVVKDSKFGWAEAFNKLIHFLYAGAIPTWDTSQLRKKGAPLKTFGGRASGPEPLEDLFNFTVRIFQNALGRRLESIECHDIACKTGESVVVGGVRRSAMISLSNLSDDRMREAKSGNWWETHPHRRLANNSFAATEKPETGVFMQEWLSLYRSKSGERGIFSRYGVQERIRNGLLPRDPNQEFGTNPCGEISLRPLQLCNLSEVVLRANDTRESLARKTRLATILGTIQSTFTKFRFVRDQWSHNCEEERLLGVSMTGIMDCPIVRNPNRDSAILLGALRSYAHEVNAEYAKALGIKKSAAVTTVKPSGTVSQLTDSSSGIHERHAEYYIRRARADKADPLTQFMTDAGFIVEDDVMAPKTTAVFSFLAAAPSDIPPRMNAKAQMDLIKHFSDNWTDHNVSCTVTVKENEWPAVGGWVYDNFDSVCGMSFLPDADHVYRQAPYEAITKAQYDEFSKMVPANVDWSDLKLYEQNDQTVGSQTIACSGNVCEVVDLVAN